MPEETQMTAGRPGSSEAVQITPQLVRQVAEKVYAMLLAETRLERERRGMAQVWGIPSRWSGRKGGR